MDDNTINNLVKQIKKKKELSGLDDEFVKNQLNIYFSKNPKIVNLLNKSLNPKSAKYKQIVKDLRSILRRVYGLFRIKEQKDLRDSLVKDLLAKKNLDLKLIKEILQTHSSTKERLSSYLKLYQKIWKITGKPKSIIDLGCGINPFSVPFMNLQELTYYAYDISANETSLLKQFFNYFHKQNKDFTGQSKVLDALNFSKLKKVDICFLFKMTDVLDRGKGHKITEQVLIKIPAKHIVVSFPTETMSGKKMNFPRRKWIELLCERLGYKYKTINLVNEIFYCICK
jgi:16S rRNA (guanine(1405)-N(7))-methyltransferase